MKRQYVELDDEDIRRLASVAPDASLPQGARERVMARILFEARPSVVAPSAPVRRHERRFGRFVSIAVAAAVMMGTCCWLFIGSVRPAVADLAEVLQRVRKATTVTFKLTLRQPGLPEDVAVAFMDAEGHSRMAFAEGRIHIRDSVNGRLLVISPETKEARLLTAMDKGWGADIVESLGKQKASDGIYLGVEKVGTTDAQVYRMPQKVGDIHIWVDPAKQIPLRVRVRKPAGEGQETIIELAEMQWNIPLDPSLLAIEAPSGYTFQQPYGDLCDKDLVYTLRVACEVNGGRFPQSLGVSSIINMNTVEIATEGGQTIGMSRLTDEEKAFLRPCLRGFSFIEKLRTEGTWTYIGAGTSLGDANTIVCWWRPAWSYEYRAVYGDLSVKNVLECDLPHMKPAALTQSSGS